jgi:hypothetical protein
MLNLVNIIAMPSFVDRIANSLSDLAILALSAIAFGLVGGLVALLSNRLWFRRWPQHSAYEDKLGDAAHTSMLGFSAFVLALLITNSLTSLSKAEDATRSEATAIYRLGRELDALGSVARVPKQALPDYARNVANDEWSHMATLPNSLSPLAQQNLDDLWIGVRSVQRSMAVTDPARNDIGAYVARIETLRAGRLSAAISNIPRVFWLILLLFACAASFLSGRETPKRFGMQINMIQMSAIGLAVGLVICLNNPFRGETSIDPEIIGNALAP